MFPPLLGGNGGTSERSIVILHVGYEDIDTSNQSLDVEEEVCALFVGDLTVSFIGCIVSIISRNNIQYSRSC
jgi:hypothetical protein